MDAAELLFSAALVCSSALFTYVGIIIGYDLGTSDVREEWRRSESGR